MDVTEDTVVAPRFTRWVRSLMLVCCEGASLGFAIGASAVSENLLQYVATNRNAQGIRQAIIGPMLTYAALIPALLLASCALPHAAGKRLRTFEVRTGILSPLCAAGFIPLLFRPELWKDKMLGFLLTTAMFSIVVMLSSQVSLRAASGLSSNRGLSDVAAVVRVLRFRIAPRMSLTLSVIFIVLLALYGLVTTSSAMKAPLPGSSAEWTLITKFSGYHDSSLWLTGIGTHAIGHVSILGALYSAWMWLWPKAEGLVWLRLFAVSWPALPLFFWARKSMETRAAWFMATVYLSMPLQAMLSANDTFPVSFSLGFFFLAAYYLQSRRFGRGLVAALVAVMLHEQATIWFVTLGLFFATQERRVAWGSWLTVLAALYFAYAAFVLLPNADVTTYTGSAPTVANASRSLNAPQTSQVPSLLNLAYVIPHWLDNQSLEFWLVLLLPLGFVPLRNSRWFVCLLPAIVWSFLSRSVSDWHTSVFTHFVTLAFVSAIVSLAQLKRSECPPRERRVAVFAGWVAALLPCIGMFGTFWLPIQR